MSSATLEVKKRPSPTALAVSTPESFDSLASSSTTATTTGPSSPSSIDSNHRAFSISSITGRSWRSFSTKERPTTPDAGHSFRSQARRLSRSRPLSSSSHIDGLRRRGSALSDDHGRLSLSTTDSSSLATAASASSSIDWAAQHVEGSAPLEPDTLRLKTKTPYLVVTTNYLVKTKSRADACALLPGQATQGTLHEAKSTTPEPLLVIPTDAIVSVFAAESARPSFGIEVWWRTPLAGRSCRSDFFFANPNDRNEQLHLITRAMRASQQDDNGPGRHFEDVRPLLDKILDVAEPRLHQHKPEIFPVVPRGSTRKEYLPKLEDATKKPQEGPAFYLIVGTYLCYLVEVQKTKGGDPLCRHRTFGLVTLECFEGEGVLHEERFNITFREPFHVPVTLELASRYYRHIIRAFGRADRFLKPAWPQLWHTLELFRISGLTEPQYLVPKEDFGSFQRTLNAYLAAYRCEDVDWEINWKTRFAPEFRLLPGKRGPYSALQLLAVLRALRYNDYFNSLSFRNVDLSVLYGLRDNTLRKVNVAYLSRTCVALGPDEIETLRVSPVLHQEFHALAFCSETIRQIDFTNCSKTLASRLAQYRSHSPSLQFLTPILSLLRSGITKCNRLLVSGNLLPRLDVDDLAETMKSGAIQALDVSYCGLDDFGLRDMIVMPFSEYPGLLQSLSLSGNPGRLPAHILPGLLQYLSDIRELNLSGSIQAESYIKGSLLPFAALEAMERLEELDISGYKIDEDTFQDLERFLQYRSWRFDHGQPLKFNKLVLNHCGITGTQAAQLFDAIGADRGMHLSLSNNPIEDGIEALAAAIRNQHGPAALYLELIEFKHEANYLTLIRSLTHTRHLTLLSLAGTAPSPSSSHGPCSDDLVATLHAFFAHNPSLKYLDLSGFSGKLDDGQLPRGFGRSLAGLALNLQLTHLRIRNQNLHDDAGTLGRALSSSISLQSLDCRANNLNLTSLRFLVDSVIAQSSSTLVEFPLPRAERDAIWRTVLRGLQRTPSSAA
ncbi:RNI-like protein, partial [Parathielavia hyrcaniae]